jgi:predicted nucleic acid-binding protein
VVAVDTSVWVEFFRGRAEVVSTLSDLLDRDEVALPVPVRIEILSGARASERARLRRVLAALPVLYPQPHTWTRIEAAVTETSTRGHRFGFADLLIATLAADNDCEVWSFDGDFRHMARLGLVTLAKV